MDFINRLLNEKKNMQIYQQSIFLEFLYLKMLNHALYILFIFIIYANMIFFWETWPYTI
jgi:polyferredoxin